jgi:hypothetical protein
MHIALHSITLVALSCSAAAQLISPAGFDTQEGSSNNTFPFYGNTFHYQAIHDDIHTVLAVKGLSFRRDGTISISSLGKTVTGAIWMGHMDYAKISTTFANNYDAGGRTAVLPSGPISLPAMPAKPATPPAAFTASIPFKSPFVYLGTKAIVWEYVCTASSSTASYIMDAHSSGRPVNGPWTRLGTGCVATGQTRNMIATAYITTYRSPDRVRYYCYTNYGTKNAPGAVLVGLTNLNLPFPICSKTLYSDGGVVIIPATSSATGYFNSGLNLYAPWSPTLTGMKFYSQTYTQDAAMSPLQVATSNGVESIVAPQGGLPGAYSRIYAYNNATATTGSLGSGYAVITRFDK